MVIQTCAWPVICSAEDPNLKELRLPASLDSFTTCYKRFYEAKHSGRVLRFAYHVSQAEVRIQMAAQKRALACMTVPQALLLLQFNTEDRLSVEELGRRNALPFEYTCSCLKALVDYRILKLNDPVSFG